MKRIWIPVVLLAAIIGGSVWALWPRSQKGLVGYTAVDYGAAAADRRVSMAGYAVRLARNCAEVVTEIRTREAPDIVLLDIMLPDGNGWDVLASLRRHPRLALLPVVMLSALNEPNEVRWGLALGADGYITKPYSKKILADTIGAVLKHL